MHTNSLEIIRNQASITLASAGSVSHGKTTLVHALSGVKTIKFKKEMEQNITIKLGYANFKIYKAENSKIERPKCYESHGSAKEDRYYSENLQSWMTLIRHISLVDTPGHKSYFSTMINGISEVDGALFLIAGNMTCPQTQTISHLCALEIAKVKNVIVVQNKLDLVTREKAVENYTEILDFMKGTCAENSPIIPISAQKNYNIDFVLDYIVNYIPVPVRDFTSPCRFTIIRSFDINKPGINPSLLKGGIIGGTLQQGILRVGDVVEIAPGVVLKTPEGMKNYKITATITSIFCENNQLDFAVPGGLVALGTSIDSCFCKSDRIVGCILGIPGTLPPVFTEVEVSYKLMKYTLNEEKTKIKKIETGEDLTIISGSMTVKCKVLAKKSDLLKLSLFVPLCAAINSKISISRTINNNLHLIGYGIIQASCQK
jgi:translation initiation factor 2 subunit 3